MKLSSTLLVSLSAFALLACGNADNSASAATSIQTTTATAEPVAAPDLSAAPTGIYTLDKSHGYITFHYDHQGYSNPWLRWRDWDATLNWNAENPSASSINVTINTAGIDSGVDVFDEHLADEKMFDIPNYPTITFASTNVVQGEGNKGTITGDLTMKGITKPVTLDVTFNKAGEDRGGGNKLGFSATTKLLRSEWGLGLYVPYVSDEVTVVIETEFVKPAAQ